MKMNIDFKSGRLVFDDFQIDENLPVEEQKEEDLKGDLLQVEYGENILLDVGFYKTKSFPNGFFKIQIIEDLDWEKPAYWTVCIHPKILKRTIQSVVNIIETNFI